MNIEEYKILKKDVKPYLFFIDIDGVEDTTCFNSLIRSVDFYRNEIIVKYFETENDFIYNGFNSNYNKEWSINYLDNTGNVIKTYKVENDICSPIIKLPMKMDSCDADKGFYRISSISIPILQYIRNNEKDD